MRFDVVLPKYNKKFFVASNWDLLLLLDMTIAMIGCS